MKTSTTVGPEIYTAWRRIRWIRKERLLERMVGKRLDIVPRKHQYADLNEVEVAIMKIAMMDRALDTE